MKNKAKNFAGDLIDLLKLVIMALLVGYILYEIVYLIYVWFSVEIF